MGADSGCTTLYTQGLDGTLSSCPITAGSPGGGPGSPSGGEPRPIAIADGYVFDARPSPARGSQMGLGLGLAISAKNMSAHGGRIWAEQRSGGGTSVSFTLPA